jgi:hypothetical protein
LWSASRSVIIVAANWQIRIQLSCVVVTLCCEQRKGELIVASFQPL